MNFLWSIKSYFNYLTKAKSKNVIHSPFVFEIVTNVLHDKTEYPDYALLNEVKKRQSERVDTIETDDFGASAGKAGYTTKRLRKGKLVKQRTTKNAQLRLLYRLIKFMKPEVILELGTAAGISAGYMKKGHPAAKLITLEGCASLADFAYDTFKKLGHTDIEVISGNFDVTLDDVIAHEEKLDFVFFDGNHRKEPTIRYFESCLNKSTTQSVFVFDDIHWSAEMEEAWEIIKANQQVSVTIDLYWMGLVFFKKGITKQDFVIRY